jgi:hypothetical protein
MIAKNDRNFMFPLSLFRVGSAPAREVIRPNRIIFKLSFLQHHFSSPLRPPGRTRINLVDVFGGWSTTSAMTAPDSDVHAHRIAL